MENAEIIRRINSFPRWHYQFNLNGNLTLTSGETRVNRHFQRKRYFFDPIVKYFGGTLKGKRVLDLGCNAGFWSWCAVEAGADFVLGIDGRQVHIDQANFVFEVNEVNSSRYKFIHGNIFEVDLQQFGTFDIVFFLGLMYHISKPMVLLEKISKVNDDILVIDTRLSMLPGSFMEIRHDDLDKSLDAMDYELVMYPTSQAVVEIARQFGHAVVMLRPNFGDYTGAQDYKLGDRRAFICAKKTDLSSLPIKPESQRRRALHISWAIARRLFRSAREGLFHR